MDRMLYPEAEARAALGGISRSKLYELFKAGELTPTKLGRRTFVLESELRRFVGKLSTPQDTDSHGGLG